MDPQALTIWRGTLLFITAVECCVMAGAAYGQGYFRPTALPGIYGMVAASLPATVVVAGTTLLSLWRFLGPRGSLAAGLLAALGMKVAAETFTAVFAVHHQDFYQGGAMLAGVVVGEAYARLLGIRPERSRAEMLEARRFGMSGALGMLAGSYMAAGTSKVLRGGFGWIASSAVRLMILSHGEVEGSTWLTMIPQWITSHPYACMGIEVATLVIQLGAFMLVLGPRARRLWASLIVAFHTGIYVTSSILFVSPLVFAAAVAVPWVRLLPRRRPDSEDHGDAGPVTAWPSERRIALALLLAGTVFAFNLASGW